MTQDELLKTYDEIKEGIDNAPESPVPFPVVKDDKVNVIGDANETQINKRDFKIVLKLPAEVDGDNDGKGYTLKEVEFKDVFITPRQSAKVVSSLCRLMPFFRKIEENTAKEYAENEVVELLAEFGDEFVDSMYDLVAKVLKIDPSLVDFMTQASVINATVKIINDYPEVINEAEAFFS